MGTLNHKSHIQCSENSKTFFFWSRILKVAINKGIKGSNSQEKEQYMGPPNGLYYRVNLNFS